MKSVKRVMMPSLLLVALLALQACSGVKDGDFYPEDTIGSTDSTMRTEGAPQEGRLFSNLGLFGGRSSKATSGLAVNSYLWRATLDTLTFMPLATAEPDGGVIITDWHANPQVPNERFKLTVYILDTRLRADGVKVSVFRQELVEGEWRDAAVNAKTATQLENQILRRARELKVGAAN